MSKTGDVKDTSADLVACPFCGSDVLEVEGDRGTRAWVICHGCDASGPLGTGARSRALAAEAWNRRTRSKLCACETDPDRLREDRDEWRRMVREFPYAE